MKIIVDTNVLVSGVFFSGPPYQILDAWRQGQVEFVVSPEILNEYYQVAEELSQEYPGTDLQPFLDLLTIYGHIVDAPPLQEQACTDVDDDKFLACAIGSGTPIIVTGDKALLLTSGYQGVVVLKPRDFVDRYLKKK